MKKMLVICATGVATSTIIIGKLKEWLKREALYEKVEIHQGKVSEAINKQNDYDFIIAATLVPEEMKANVIDGVPLLTGTGAGGVYANIKVKILES
ncbi:PTS sugar transporter subunit IIB [Virgibacillus ainsalahensis]